MPTATDTLQFSALKDWVDLGTYEQDLRDLSEAGFKGERRNFKNDVARDIGGLVVIALYTGELDQARLEEVLQSKAPWGQRAREYDKIDGERSVMFELARASLTAYYYGPAQTEPTFSDRKAVRSQALGTNRTFAD